MALTDMKDLDNEFSHHEKYFGKITFGFHRKSKMDGIILRQSKEEPIVLKLSQKTLSPKKDGKLKANKKNKKRSFWLRHLLEFFKVTNLHGYKYIAMEEISTLERFCWSLAVFSSLIAAICLMVTAWKWNLENPTISVIETTQFPVWKFPFPAVTVCSLNKASKTKVTKFVKTLNMNTNLNITTEDVLSYLGQTSTLLGNVYITDKRKLELENLQRVLDYNNVSTNDLLTKLSPTCEEILERCSWKGAITRCNAIFKGAISSEGHCCSFNYNGYKNGTTWKYPRRVAACGYQAALTVLFKISPNDYFSSTYGTMGVRIFVHNQYEYPDEGVSGKLAGPGSETFLEVTPESIYAIGGIATLALHKRKCIFSNETRLEAFNIYTYSNCLVECRARAVYDMCKCIPYFLPNTARKRVCNFRDVSCVNEARQFYLKTPPRSNITCSCLPDCKFYKYPLELSSGKLSTISIYNSQGFFKDIKLSNQSLFHVYFSDLSSTRYKMDLFYNWYNLFASFGGLLSLFIGLSLVSGFELLYFFTIRFFFDMTQSRKVAEESQDNSTGLADGQLLSKWMKKHNTSIIAVNAFNSNSKKASR